MEEEELHQRKHINKEKILTEEEQQRQIYSLERSQEKSEVVFRTIFGIITCVIAGFFVGSGLLLLYMGECTFLPPRVDKRSNFLIFFVSAVSMLATATRLQKNIVPKQMTPYLAPIEKIGSILALVYWFLVSLFIMKSFNSRIVVYGLLPGFFLLICRFVDHELGSTEVELSELKQLKYELKGA